MATRRIREFLRGNQAPYAIITHSPAFTAVQLSETSRIPCEEVAKTVVVKIDRRLAIAATPADKSLDLELLAHQIKADHVSLAKESELAERFLGCQIGTAPPFGNVFGMKTYIDIELTRQKYIAFAAGTHTDLIVMPYAEYQRVAEPVALRLAVAAYRRPEPWVSGLGWRDEKLGRMG